ncbi:MAG: class I SAM-dependent DNA methyltransferase [Hyphomicrobiales bacterium]|nr:class I SAM-dependent DNA methyltransferase [Hyphomicrobiales bacterium]
MTPHEFVDKWSRSELKESAGAQEHFIDLCRLFGEATPAEADPKGEEFTFEKGAMKTGGGGGWADVWKKGHFAWEYKGKHANLDKAFEQLQRYAIALENPPLLIVSDMERFIIHTNWTNTVQEIHDIQLEELLDGRRRQLLEYAFRDPIQLKPRRTRQDLTEEVAGGFARLALDLRERGHDPEGVAHFVNRLVFCMFAEDVHLLPNKMFTRMLEVSRRNPEEFEEHSRQLFAAMRKGGAVGFERVEWFNGGLFDDDSTLPLTADEIKQTLDVAYKDWSNIEPSIMGTLFERGLDPDKRSQLGAHYTDRDKIMLIVAPVIVEPLTREWNEARGQIEALMERHRTHKTKSEQTKAYNDAQRLHRRYLDKLKNFRVLDPACGSGNFLYLSLLALKDLEHKANLDAEALGLPREFPAVGPECLKGIEINPFAAELARVSVWIGEIQWMRANGFSAARNPILRPLDTIECRDALLDPDGSEAGWPKADAIVGNPPFLGDRRMIRILGEAAVQRIRNTYENRVPGSADLVCYWFAKANDSLIAGDANGYGLVATKNIRSGANRKVLDDIPADFQIDNAWRDEPWTVEGAAVRVSVVCVSKDPKRKLLDGRHVDAIHSDLTSAALTIASAQPMQCNRRVAFVGVQKNGPFDLIGDEARRLLALPLNPNGRPNSDVLRPAINGGSIVGRNPDRWLIDFGPDMELPEAQLYEAPFEYVREHVKPTRQNLRRTWHREKWWLHGDPRPALRRAVLPLDHMLVSPMVSKHRVFVFVPTSILPENKSIAFARDDFTFFGILQSKFHEHWSLSLCSYIGVGNDPSYSPSRCFETFPFPEGLTPNIPAADYANDPRAKDIAKAAKRLNELRENWQNPEDLVERVPEVVEGYPDLVVPKHEKALAILKKRTLTNLYNERPAWLEHAHKALDEAVAAAYGWPAGLADEEMLKQLFQLNQERVGAEKQS